METSKRPWHTLNRSLHGMRGIALQCLPSVWICSPLAEVGTQMSSSCGDTYFNVQAESHFQVYFSSHTQMFEAIEIHVSVTPALERLLQTGIPPVSFQTCPGVTPALRHLRWTAEQRDLTVIQPQTIAVDAELTGRGPHVHIVPGAGLFLSSRT